MIRKTHFLYEEQRSGATLKLSGCTAPFIANLCICEGEWKASLSGQFILSERHQELTGVGAWVDASIGVDML
jgi:hypothetical protein